MVYMVDKVKDKLKVGLIIINLKSKFKIPTADFLGILEMVKFRLLIENDNKAKTLIKKIVKKKIGEINEEILG